MQSVATARTVTEADLFHFKRVNVGQMTCEGAVHELIGQVAEDELALG